MGQMHSIYNPNLHANWCTTNIRTTFIFSFFWQGIFWKFELHRGGQKLIIPVRKSYPFSYSFWQVMFAWHCNLLVFVSSVMDMILCFLNANFSYLYNSEKDIKLIKKKY
jgi:hypothetical protein